MELNETIDRILSDISNEEDILTKQHYIPIRFFKYYLSLAYSIGYNEGSKSRSNQKPIIRIKDNETKTYLSQADAARDMKVDKSDICKALKHKTTYKGYQWKYI
jgi:hypothetical protein